MLYDTIAAVEEIATNKNNRGLRNEVELDTKEKHKQMDDITSSLIKNINDLKTIHQLQRDIRI